MNEVNPTPTSILTPTSTPTDRNRLRWGWGIHDDTPVVALLSDPPTAADAWTAALIVGLVRSASGVPMRLLVHPQQQRRTRTQDHLDRGPDADLLIQDARLDHPETVLPGCDAALFVNPYVNPSVNPPAGPGPTRSHSVSRAAQRAVAAGLPVAAPDTPAHRAALAGATATVGFAPHGQPKKLADRLLHQALQLPGLARSFVPPEVPGMTLIS